MYRIDLTNTSSETGTIEGDAGIRYTDLLNDVNDAEINISGSGNVKRTLVEIGSTIKIYRNDTLEFHGRIEIIDFLDGGAMKLTCSGFESWLAKEPGTYANSPYKSTASATIATEIIAESSYLTAGTIEAGTDLDFRIKDSSSLLNSLGNLISKTAQDFQVDYVNSEIDILDHRGSSSVVATLNDGLQITNLRVTHGYPQGNSIKVYGKGDGSTQITATSSDATSIAAYGTCFMPVIDLSIMSTAEAQKLADATKAIYKDPTKVYSFEVLNPNESLLTGDHIYLNSHDKGLSNEEVRIVGMERGRTPKSTEFLTLQVTNAAFSRFIKHRNSILAEIAKNQRDRDTHMQGSGNYIIEGGQINADSTFPLRLEFDIDSRFEDEAGNLRVEELLLDYDIDKYRKAVGGASFTGSDPPVQNSSGSENVNTLSGNSGNQNDSSLSGNTGYTGGMTGTEQTSSDIDSGNVTLKTNGDWVKIEDVNPDGSETSGMFVTVAGIINGSDFWRLEFKVVSTSGTTYAQTTVFTSGEPTIWNHFQCMMFVAENTSNYNYDVYVRVKSQNGSSDETWACFTSWYTVSQHRHDASGLSSDNHQHAPTNTTADTHTNGAGDYDINSTDLNHISIGDDVEDKNLNATQLNYIYLEKYNGSPADPSLDASWTTKHTITNTGKTLDTDVDISNSGTYPDSKGRWRVRLLTNSASPDLVKTIVKIKSALDN